MKLGIFAFLTAVISEYLIYYMAWKISGNIKFVSCDIFLGFTSCWNLYFLNSVKYILVYFSITTIVYFLSKCSGVKFHRILSHSLLYSPLIVITAFISTSVYFLFKSFVLSVVSFYIFNSFFYY